MKILLSVLMLVAGGLVWRNLVPSAIVYYGEWFLLLYFILFAFMLPQIMRIILFLITASLTLSLYYINDENINLTRMPLTLLDLNIAIANPRGLWEALGIPQWTLHATLILLFFVLISTAIISLRRTRNNTNLRINPTHLITSTVLLITVLGETKNFAEAHFLAARKVSEDFELWSPDGITELSQSMGIVPFLSYSYFSMSDHTGDIFLENSTTTLSKDSINNVSSQVARYTKDAAKDPNIVFVLAESAFDPNKAFHLNGVYESALFTPNAYTKLLAPLKVNAVGGGTWLTEFEVITGLDSRLFGLPGYYTHSSVSPFIKKSFITYLKDLGYETLAYYSTPGSFYNARNAYMSYGFQRFIDILDLGHDDGWLKDDKLFVKMALDAISPPENKPFFAFILTSGNHAPHKCTHKEGGTNFDITFDGKATFSKNCQLNKYLSNLESTESSVNNILYYLEQLEQETGRPFVLVVFGDHQPHTFVKEEDQYNDYTSLRTNASIKETFVHVMSSIPVSIFPPNRIVPVSALPSIASIFVAQQPDDIFLGVNLLLWAQCGADFLPNKGGDTGFYGDDAYNSGTPLTDDCKTAYKGALRYFRDSILDL